MLINDTYGTRIEMGPEASKSVNNVESNHSSSLHKTLLNMDVWLGEINY